MLDRLPEFVDPLAFAERGRELTGVMQLASLPRLSTALADQTGSVKIELFFAMDGKIACISGVLVTTLYLECRNCLQAFAWPINNQFSLGVVSTLDEIALLPGSYEPLLLEENRIATKDIIEDELLLSLPAFPRHETQCTGTQFVQAPIEETVQSKTDNPFAVLAKLKNTGD